MAIPSVDINEDKPAGTRGIKLGDNDIREHKKQIREIMSINHEYPSTGNSDTAGQHTKVTLQEAADIGTGAEGVPILGAQTIATIPELVYTTEDDTDIQLTQGEGQFYGAPEALTGMAGIMNLIYPVGFVLTLGVSMIGCIGPAVVI